MKADDVFKSLKNAYPFIYKTEKMGYKYIGAGVYRDCTENEKELFEEYWKEIRRIHFLKYTPNKEDVCQLVNILYQILDFGNSEYSDEKAKVCLEKIWECLQPMSLNELQALSEQKEYFLEALDYKDEAFYRHSRE